MEAPVPPLNAKVAIEAGHSNDIASLVGRLKIKPETLRLKHVNVDDIDENNLETALIELDWPKLEYKEPPIVTESLREKIVPLHLQEPNHIVYSFNDTRVKERLMKLMNTDIVRIMDREWMQKLQDRIAETHRQDLEKRVKKRMEDEVKRETEMALHGILPKEIAPKGVQKILNTFDSALADATYKPPVRTSILKVVKTEPEVDYRPFMTEEEKYPPSPGSDISPVHSDIPEDDEIEVVRKQCIVEMQDELDRLYIQPENYEKMRFETNSVKQLREAKDVDTMYQIADKIYKEV